jgi:hypothetical protein
LDKRSVAAFPKYVVRLDRKIQSVVQIFGRQQAAIARPEERVTAQHTKWRTVMKTLITAVTLATLMVSSAFAQWSDKPSRYSAGEYDRDVNGSMASTPGQN